MASSKVVGGIFLATDELLRVEELAVSSSPNFIHHRGLQVHEHTPWYMLACPSLAEECVEGIVSSSHRLVTRHLSIRLHINSTLSDQSATKTEMFI
jgi:hypothetical protein